MTAIKTQVLFDATRPVKTNRNRPFAAGLLAYVPHSRSTGPAAQEEAEYRDMLADREQAQRDFDEHLDEHLEERALRAMEMDRVCRGAIL